MGAKLSILLTSIHQKKKNPRQQKPVDVPKNLFSGIISFHFCYKKRERTQLKTFHVCQKKNGTCRSSKSECHSLFVTHSSLSAWKKMSRQAASPDLFRTLKSLTTLPRRVLATQHYTKLQIPDITGDLQGFK